MAKQRSARERNASVRAQQQRLSEERRLRSLRTEDFQSDDEYIEPPRGKERVRFSSMNTPEERRTYQREEQPVRRQSRKAEKSRKSQRRRAALDAEARKAKARTDEVRAVEVRQGEVRQGEPEELWQSSETQEPVEEVKETKRREKGSARDRLVAWTKPISKSHESNFSMVASIVLLCFIGLVMITSSSYYYAYNNMGAPLYFLYRQSVSLAIGIALMIIATFVPLRIVKSLSWAVYRPFLRRQQQRLAALAFHRRTAVSAGGAGQARCSLVHGGQGGAVPKEH